jgi:hypothetical protein
MLTRFQESKAAHHAISTLFPEPIDPKDKPLVVQYEVKLQKGLDCGGAYIKLLTESDSGEGLRAGEDYTDKVSGEKHGIDLTKDSIHYHVWTRQMRVYQ